MKSKVPASHRVRLDLLVVLTAAVAMAGVASSVHAQTGANVRRDLRPLVAVNGGTNPADPLYLGLYDTGALGFFIPPTTNSLAQIPVVFTGTQANPNQTNYGIVGGATQYNIYGMLGMGVGGPEVQTPGPTPPAGNPAQIFNLDPLALRSQGAPIQSQPLNPALNYYNGSFNNVIVGGAFYNGNATRLPTVGFVDPIQAMWSPIPFGTTGPNIPDPNGASGPLDYWSSSVTVFESGVRVPLPLGGFVDVPNSRIPTTTRNQNPNFLFSIPMTPVNLAGAVSPNGFTSYQRTATTTQGAATEGYRPRVQLTPAVSARLGLGQNDITGTNNGIAAPSDNRLIVADTGAPNTGTLLGTDYLNGFGQYWDFSAIPLGNGTPQILLFGPRRKIDRDLLGPGALITVDRSAQGISRTGVDEFRTIGRPPLLSPVGAPGNANGLPDAGGTPGSHPVTFFRTHMTASNAGYVDGSAAMNLAPAGDQLDSATLGADHIKRRSTVFFSVDQQSIGLAVPTPHNNFGGGVFDQTMRNQQAGDIFESNSAQPAPVFGVNGLRFNQDVMGLEANVGPKYDNSSGDFPHDNLRDFDLDTIKGYYNGQAANVMRNFDPVITSNGDARNPGANVPSSFGATPAPAARNDVYGVNFRTYFSLEKGSATLGAGNSGADVLYNDPAAAAPFLFAPAAASGLAMDDDIDAIALSRTDGLIGGIAPAAIPGVKKVAGIDYVPYNPLDEFDGIDRFDPRFAGVMSDLMVFSLARMSPSLTIFEPFLGRMLSAADLFITDFDGTFSLYASAESLGLDPFLDNIDGLDLTRVPEPGALLLLLIGAAFMLGRRRR